MAFDSTGFGQPRLLPATLEDRLVRLFGRVCGVCLLAGLGLMWATFITWSASDPSLTFATANPARNAVGPLGAIVSDLLLQTLGLGALIALLAPMQWGLALAFGERLAEMRMKVCCYPLAVLLLGSALSALPVSAGWPFHHGYGGVLGDGVHALATTFLGPLLHAKAGLAAGAFSALGGWACLMASVGLESGAVLTGLGNFFSAGRSAVRADVAAADPLYEAPQQGPYEVAPGTRGPHTRGYQTGDYDSEPRLPFGSSLSIDAGLDDAPIGPRWREAPPAGPAARAAYAYPAPQTYPPEVFAGTSDGASAGTSAAASAGTSAAASAAWAPHFVPHGFGPDVAPGASPAPAPPNMPVPPPVEQFEAAARAAHAPFTGDLFGLTRILASVVAKALPAPPAPAVAASPPSATALAIAAFERDAEDEGTDGTIAATSRAMAERFAPPGAGTKYGKDRKRQPQIGPGATLMKGLKFAQAASAFSPPPVSLIQAAPAPKAAPEVAQSVLRGSARLLEDVLGDFGVKGEVRDIRPGPVVTLFEFEPARGIKASRVINLADDIARSLSAVSVRVAVVPGRNVIGIELPNARRATVSLREMLESEAYRSSDAVLPLALGRGIGGEPVVVDLARMPHLLVAGTTGSGKSVGVNAMILSLLFRHSPAECRLLLIDPKMLELSVYNGIPHLLTPVVTDPVKAVAALHWAVGEMEERYKRMAMLSVRNIEVFNNRVRNAKKRGEKVSRTVQTGFDSRTGEAVYEQASLALEPLPYIVIVVDEFADLMATAGKDVEAAVQRLAQMARAAGIHLIMATQRPSVDVVTGTIKANFPSRIGFKVASKIDSRTILNDQGAEQLLGHGDMLYATGAGAPIRVHGAFVADEDVEAIARSLSAQAPPDYVMSLRDGPAPPETTGADSGPASEADLYDRAVAVVLRDRKASTSYLQRRLGIGYNRAADLIERLEQDGLVSRADAVGRREILAPPEAAA